MAEQSLFSSSFTPSWTYDVFLNFRGEDTRFDFTRNLYYALDLKGIRTFMDDEGLRRGEEITPSLLKAIHESRTAITIFSRNYASSTFCLDELVQILDCIKEKGRFVLPVFYNVEPSEVRHQRESYSEAFAQHEKRFKNDKKKVQKWRQALREAADLSGLPFKPGQEYEYHFIQRIVKEVSVRINRRPLRIADHPVGLVPRVLKVNILLDFKSNEGVQMVGICGIGGIGKSTIARAVCNLIFDQFEGFCFLIDVRENSQKHGLVYLQKMLLSEVVGEDINLRDVNKAIPIIKHKLQRKKVLIVLDDVDDIEQLQVIAGGLDWFGSGSRIIVTTRDKQLLARHDVERIYEVEGLNKKEALELLRWNAFRQNKVDPSYKNHLNNVVLYACGLPLALEVIGSNLFKKGINVWNSALDEYRRIPIKKIQQILKVSYDALEEYEQEIFLDIACCFKGDTLEYVRSALYAHGICPDNGIEVLIDRCLVKIDSDHVTMHDLIQDMGKEVVRQQSPKKPGKRTRLWFHEDILQVLEENKGTEKIEAINMDMPGDNEINWSGTAFKKMRNLKMLIVRNARFSTGPKHLPNSLRVLDWKGYPCPSFPSDFYPQELIILKMPESCLKLDEQLKKFQSMSVMDFKRCKFLRAVPDLSGVPNLKELCLDDCDNLIEVHVSLEFLDKLKRLSVKRCTKLKTFPNIRSTSLEFLDFSWCSNLRRFPEILETMENIRDIHLDNSGIEELPLSFRNLIGLEELNLSSCKHLREVRAIPPNLKKLGAINRDLSSESCSILLSQAFREIDGLRFIIQEYRMPEWFDHSNVSQFQYGVDTYFEGHSMSFWIRNKFPNMAFCLGLQTLEQDPDNPLCLNVKVYINGKLIGSLDRHTIYGTITLQHIFLFDLRLVVPEDKLKSVVLEHEWNHVEISCNLFYRLPFNGSGYGGEYIYSSAEWCGIYVYKQKSRMEDIRFINHNVESLPEFLEGSSPYKSQHFC